MSHHPFRFGALAALAILTTSSLAAPALAPIELQSQWTALGDFAGAIDKDNDTASVRSVEFSPNARFVVAGSRGVLSADGKRRGQCVSL